MEVIEVGRSKQFYSSFPEHQHGYWEILLNVQGSGNMSIEGRRYAFKPGDIFVIPPYTIHKKESREGFIDMGMFIKNFRAIGKESLKCFCDDEKASVRQIMEMAYRFTRTENPYERAAVNAMGDLVYQILVCYYNRVPKKDMRLEGIIELMHDNISNPYFDLAAAIDESGYCKGYFRKIFKKAVGEPPVGYFNCLRINHAKSLFHQYGESRTVKDIATASGFTDPLYFSRVFKQCEGMSPKEYMEQMKIKDLGLIVMDTPKDFI